MEAIGEHGQLDLSTTRPNEEVRSGYTQFCNGDVVVAKITPYFENGKGALIQGMPQGIGFGTTELYVLTPNSELDGRFLYYITVSHRFRKLGEACMTGAAGQQRVPEDFVRDFSVVVPPVPQQRAIADYLDRETARIDALIAAKERLLELLAEKRRAIITRAVTRGLDPDVPMRDSGVPWLGEIPAHWKVVRLRFLFHQIEQGWSPQAESREPDEEEWGVLKLNAVNKGRFDDSAAKALPEDLEPQTNLEIRAGDFLVTRSNTPALVGDVCFVEKTRPRLMLCDLIYRLALRTEVVDGKFMGYFLSHPIGRSQIECDARGTSASMVKISQEHIKDWLIPLPSIDEQQAIVRQLAKELAPIRQVSTFTEGTIALLKERRAALIAAAVTGQIDVPRDVQDE